jgi:hypothetical protein
VSITKKAFSFFGGLAITTVGAAMPGDGNPVAASILSARHSS